jgi:ABC-type amino acid transport substrate-binding protein
MTFLNPTPGKVTLLADSNLADQAFDSFYVATDIEITVSPGAPPKPKHVPLAAAAHTGPAVLDGVVYAGTDGGKLQAFNVADATPVLGFPVDVAAAVGESVKITGRPAG